LLIDIQCVDGSSIAESDFPAYLARLPPSWRRETLLYKAFSRQKESALGKLLLLTYLTARAVDPDTVTRAPSGKPRVEGGPFFSISHSRGLVCAAFCGGAEVGVDIEAARRAPPRLSRFFHAAEKEYAAAREDEKEAFYYLWTRKEAFLKARGNGWTADAGRYNCAAPERTADGVLWHLASFAPREGYAGAVCAAAAFELSVTRVCAASLFE
jgi:phosphopantetheinyl transferase